MNISTYQQNKLGIALDVGDLVDQRGNGLAADTHLGAVDKVSVFFE